MNTSELKQPYKSESLNNKYNDAVNYLRTQSKRGAEMDMITPRQTPRQNVLRKN